MHDQKQPADDARGVISVRAAGTLTGAAVFVAAVVMIADSLRMGAGWAVDGPMSGYFPLRIGVIICIASAAIIYRYAVRGEGRGRAFVTRAQLRPVLAIAVPTALFIAGMQFIGIYVSAAVFIAAFMRAMGGFGWLKSALVSVGTSAVLFWLFEVRFLVPLPKGPLEAMLGY